MQEHNKALSYNRTVWTEGEVKRLNEVICSLGIKWLEIAKHMPNRNQNQCAQKCKVDRGRTYIIWDNQEDQQLLRKVNKHGKKLTVASKQMAFKTAKQCRERYLNILDENLKSEAFTKGGG